MDLRPALYAIAETVKEAGTCPAGFVYAAISTKGYTYEDYTIIIRVLREAKLIKTTNETLTWIGK